jgi:hypothetical protein
MAFALGLVAIVLGPGPREGTRALALALARRAWA